MGAALLLAGIVAAIASSPIFDRVLTHHLGITVRILCPIIGVFWLSLIWAGKTAVLLFTTRFILTYAVQSK
jgi:FLVCR family MFS transporter 7